MKLYDYPFEMSVRDISVSTLLNLDRDEIKSLTVADLAIIDEIDKKLQQVRRQKAPKRPNRISEIENELISRRM